MTSEHLFYGKSQSQRAYEIKRGKAKKSFSRGFFPRSDFWQREDILAVFLTKERCLISDEIDSVLVLG